MPPPARVPLSICLVAPTARFRDSYLRALRAWREEGLAWHLAVDLDAVENDFAAFVAQKLAEARPADPSALPKTQLWAVAGDEIVGRVGILQRLTEALRLDGGHIGYDTVPAYRGRGVATEMLRQALPFARALGLTEVRLTCNADNVASARVIEKNGGVRVPSHDREDALVTKRRYVITLDESHGPALDAGIAPAAPRG